MTQIWIALIIHLMLQYLKMLISGSCPHYSLMKLLPSILTTRKNLWSVLNKLPPKGWKNINQESSTGFVIIGLDILIIVSDYYRLSSR